MPREAPDLDWLRVFVETAAIENFALAAQSLGVTPGAVSQRIKALEAFLGVSLFQRYPQGVKLTEVGKRYAQRLAPAMDQMIAATREITSPSIGKTIRVTILPALAQLWLGPRMDSFHTAHSNTTVEIWADAEIVDLRTSNFDVAIRYDKPPFPGCEFHELFFDELVPVASPALMAKSEADERGLPIGAPLLLDTYWSQDFTDWLTRAGMPQPEGMVTHTFSLYSMTVDATVQGRGFMIGHTSLVQGLIDRGDLVALSPHRVPARRQFFMLTKTGPLSEPAERFVNWMLDQSKSA